MITPELQASLAPRKQILTILWVAMTSSIAAYVAVAFMIAPQDPPSGSTAMLRLALYGVASALAVMSLLLPARMFEQQRARLRQPEGTADERARTLVAAYFTPFIVRLALNEAIAIFGLVLAILSANPDDVLPFAGGAMLLNLLAFPNLERVLERGE